MQIGSPAIDAPLPILLLLCGVESGLQQQVHAVIGI